MNPDTNQYGQRKITALTKVSFAYSCCNSNRKISCPFILKVIVKFNYGRKLPVNEKDRRDMMKFEEDDIENERLSEKTKFFAFLATVADIITGWNFLCICRRGIPIGREPWPFAYENSRPGRKKSPREYAGC